MSRKSKIQYQSKVSEAVHHTVTKLFRERLVSASDMRQVDQLCLVNPLGKGRGHNLTSVGRYDTPKNRRHRKTFKHKKYPMHGTSNASDSIILI